MGVGLLSRVFRRGATAGDAPPDGALRVAWAATTRDVPCANLGDALSPLIVAALSGRPVVHADFDEGGERIAAIGTIAHSLRGGHIHLWGCGADAGLWPRDGSGQALRPPGRIEVHALRGPRTAALLRVAGLDDVPAVYGDPALLLPHLFDLTPAPRYDLGIVPHFSELDAIAEDAGPRAGIARYDIPAEWAGQIRLIRTWTRPEPGAIFERIAEILSCRRILSRSLHGLVIAEAFGIPAMTTGKRGKGATAYDLDGDDRGMDHRFVDYYLGTGRSRVVAYAQGGRLATDWADVMAAIDRHAAPLTYDPASLTEAFPWRRDPLSPLAIRSLPPLIEEIKF